MNKSIITLVILLVIATSAGIHYWRYNAELEASLNESLQDLNYNKQMLNETENSLVLAKIKTAEVKKELTDALLFHTYYDKALYALSKSTKYAFSGGDNYDLFSYYYENGYSDDAVFYCVQARNDWRKANVETQKAKQYFQKAKNYSYDIYFDLTTAYVKLMDVDVELNWALYEACEYFESASKSYDAYDYVTGDSALAKGNLKINKHDDLVIGYNELYAEIDALKEMR